MDWLRIVSWTVVSSLPLSILGILTTAPHHLSPLLTNKHVIVKHTTEINFEIFVKHSTGASKDWNRPYPRCLARVRVLWNVEIHKYSVKPLPQTPGQWPGPLLSEWGQHHLERRRRVSYKARTKHIAKTWEIASTLWHSSSTVCQGQICRAPN